MATGVPPNFQDSFAAPCLRAAEFSLGNHLYAQAAFYAERVLAQQPDNVNALELLIDSLLRENQVKRVRWLLQARRDLTPRLRYLLAVACLRLEKYAEVEASLFNGDLVLASTAASGNTEALIHVAGGAPGLFILGQAAEGMKRHQQALECYARCLELAPFMWSAYERLSYLSLSVALPRCTPKEFAGTVFDPSRILKDSILFPKESSLQVDQTLADARSEKQGWQDESSCPRTPGKKRRRIESGKATPPFNSPPPSRVPLASRQPQVFNNNSDDREASPCTPLIAMRAPASRLWSRLSPRRLLSSPLSWRGLDSTFQSEPPARLSKSRISENEAMSGLQNNSDVQVITQDNPLSKLLQTLGQALHSFHRYDCDEALRILRSLPTGEQASAFTKDLAARCHFELAEYAETREIYKDCCEQHKFHCNLHVEHYSSALWHLKDDLALNDLSRCTLEWDRQRPQVWCVAGNGFSRQQEHEQAMRCFQRAIQLDPTFAYAYTLLGHELAAMDKHDKALEMYEQAIASDCRHYNAWWGLGNIYQRQEEFTKARYHFQRAVDINPSNAVLLTSLGGALQALGEVEKALTIFTKIAQGKQCRAMGLFQKGCTLSSLGRHEEALPELRLAQGLAPREPCVHFHLGKAHAGIGDLRKALVHYTTAIELYGAKGSRDHQLVVSAQEELLKLTSVQVLGSSAKDGDGALTACSWSGRKRRRSDRM